MTRLSRFERLRRTIALSLALVAALAIGPSVAQADVSPSRPVEFRGAVYFLGDGIPAGSRWLYRTDGSVSGTARIARLCSLPPGGCREAVLGVVGDALVATEGRHAWKLRDGALEPLAAAADSTRFLRWVDGHLVGTSVIGEGDGQSTAIDVLASDLTTWRRAGTVPAKYAGVVAVTPSGVVFTSGPDLRPTWPNTLYACSPSDGCLEIDGTAHAHAFTTDGRLLFLGHDAEHGEQPWVSDGTAGGTHRISDAPSFTNGTWRLSGVVQGDRWYLGASDAGVVSIDVNTGRIATVDPDARFGAWIGARDESSLWVMGSAGTTYGQQRIALDSVGGGVAATAEVESIVDQPDPVAMRDRIVWIGYRDALWVSDATAAGTTKIAQLPAGPSFRGSAEPSVDWALRLGALVYFDAGTPGSGRHGLWRTDGTSAGTFPLTPIGRFTPLAPHLDVTRATYRSRPTRTVSAHVRLTFAVTGSARRYCVGRAAVLLTEDADGNALKARGRARTVTWTGHSCVADLVLRVPKRVHTSSLRRGYLSISYAGDGPAGATTTGFRATGLATIGH